VVAAVIGDVSVASFMLVLGAQQDVVVQWCFWCCCHWQLNDGVNFMANCDHCCCHHCCHWHHWHHHCQLLDVVHWVAETGGPTLCDLVADGVNVNLKRLSIIDEVNGRLVMVNGGWYSSWWHCYGFLCVW